MAESGKMFEEGKRQMAVAIMRELADRYNRMLSKEELGFLEYAKMKEVLNKITLSLYSIYSNEEANFHGACFRYENGDEVSGKIEGVYFDGENYELEG